MSIWKRSDGENHGWGLAKPQTMLVTAPSGLKIQLEEAGLDANGNQLWRQVSPRVKAT
jgi:hypothetical protein